MVLVCILGHILEAYTEKHYTKYKSPNGAAANNKHCQVDCDICGDSAALQLDLAKVIWSHSTTFFDSCGQSSTCDLMCY